MRKLLAVVLAAFLLIPVLAACGEEPAGSDWETVAKTKLTVYMGGNEGNNARDNQEVAEALAKKFYEDTGNAVELDFTIYSNADFSQMVGLNLADSSQNLDGIYYHMGDTDGINVYVKDGTALDITDLLNQYGPNIKEKLGEELEVFQVARRQMGITGQANRRTYGLLIRKDWLDEAVAAGQVTLSGESGLPETIEEFNQMLRAFKARGSGMVPMVGQPWDVESIFAGAFDTVQYFNFFEDADGKLSLGYLHPNREKLLKQMYDWSSEGLWDRDNKTTSQEDADRYWLSGKTGVYCFYPDATHLAAVSMKLKVNEPDAELAVLPPLTGPDGACKGYIEGNYTGLIIPKKSQNAALLIQYIDWLWSDVENYELAAYGIEGKHWTDAGEGLRGFPNKAAENLYRTNPPYVNKYLLIPNASISDRILDIYDEQERQIFADIKSFQYQECVGMDMLFPDLTDQNIKTAIDLQVTEMKTLLEKIWAGIQNPSEVQGSGKSVFQSRVDDFALNGEAYLNWLDNQYQLILTYREM